MNKIGISSGEILAYVNNRVKYVKVFKETPRGGARIWSKECFTRTGGYVVSVSRLGGDGEGEYSRVENETVYKFCGLRVETNFLGRGVVEGVHE